MGDRRWEMGDGRWEMGDRRWEMGDGRWEIGDRNPLTHPPPPRQRKGLGVGLVSPKALNNKAQGALKRPWALLCNRVAVGNV